MQLQSVFLAVLGATTVSAHFRVTYPFWRGDSTPTQYTYPCGGVNQTESANNRTLWPLDGGPFAFLPTHHDAQTFINLGLGNEVTRLNISLIPTFNQTGNGTFCFPKLQLPAGLDIQEGTNGSIQIIQLSAGGGALYNCADVTFSSQAVTTLSSDICFNSTNVGISPFSYDSVAEAPHGHAETCNTTSDNGTAAGGSASGAVSNLKISIASVGAVGLAVAALMM